MRRVLGHDLLLGIFWKKGDEPQAGLQLWKVEDSEKLDRCAGVLQPQRHEAEDFVNEVPVKEGASEVDLHVAGAFLHEPLPK